MKMYIICKKWVDKKENLTHRNNMIVAYMYRYT